MRTRSTTARSLRALICGVVLGGLLVANGPPTASAVATQPDDKVEPGLLDHPDGEELVFWVNFRAQADLAVAPKIADFAGRGQLVVDRLQNSADTSQSAVADLLAGRGITHESFWISNSMRITGSKKLVLELAGRPEVERVLADRTYGLPDPVPAAGSAPESVEWNVAAIRAGEVWSGLGTTGQGIVVANLDTGVQFDHPALVNQYRGNHGGTFDHNYNWYDPAGVCGSPSIAPCDNYGHGTHTMGTMVGDDGTGNRIGVAPGARWIAAKGCEYSSCSTGSLLAAGQWLLAPTDLNGQNPRPDLRPNIVNNSWGGPGQDPFFQDIVTSWVASGIFPVFSNGNSGPGCGTAGSPADYADSYAVGADDSSGAIAGFSSRGSSAPGAIKPDIVAPGVSVRSSVPGNSYSAFSGTSMAAPHVAATVALMWSAAPSLVSDVAATRSILDQTAIDTPDLTCGGTGGDNRVWGEGRLDAFAAVDGSPRGATGLLTGVVSDATTSLPLPGVTIRSERDGQVPRLATTDPAGGYRQRLSAGTYQVSVELFGFSLSQIEVVIRDNETTTSDRALTSVPRYGVSGTVRDVSGSPLEGVKVSVPDTTLAAQSTDAGGVFRFAGVPGGTYQFVVSGSNCVSSDSRQVPVGADTVVDFSLTPKRDGFGYSCRLVSPAYIEAGTVLPLTGDDGVIAVPLPFPFSFYGLSYTEAYASTNGMLGLAGASSSYANVALPDLNPPNGAIYPFWDDLYVDPSSSMRTSILGAAPDRRLVVEWRSVSFYANSALRIDFEVILDEGGGIVFQYRDVANDPMVGGASATIGLEDATGANGFDYSDNRVALTSPSTAIRFDNPSTISPVNHLPRVADDSARVLQDSSVTVDVLANDTDPDGDALAVTSVSDPPHGTARSNPDRTVTYSPDAGFSGPDAFTYLVGDGHGGEAQATVNVTVDRKKTLQVPLTLWAYPSVPSLDGVGGWVIPFNEPTAAPGQLDPAYAYSQSFWYSDVRASGIVSLGVGPAGKTASLAITRVNGTTDRAQIPYPWVGGGAYFLLVYHLGGGHWGGWVVDGATGSWTAIGSLMVSPQNQTLYPATVTHMAWSGAGTADCAAYPLAQALMLASSGYSAGLPRASSNVPVARAAGDCATTIWDGPGWVYYALGVGPAGP